MIADALRLVRRRALVAILLPIALFTTPQAVVITEAIVHHVRDFVPRMLAVIAGQLVLGMILQTAITQSAMSEAAASGRFRRGLRLGLWVALWEGLCATALSIGFMLALFVMVIAALSTGNRQGWAPVALGGAVVGWSCTTWLMARWALVVPALATRDHPGLRAAMRRSAELTRGRRRGMALLQGVFLAGILALLVADGLAQMSHVKVLLVALFLATLPVTGLLLSFDTLMKVAAYRALGGREAVEGAAAIADLFE